MSLLLQLPRVVRIVAVFVVAVATVLAIFALVDRIYIYYLMTPNTLAYPSYVSVTVGGFMYVWGYVVFVGTRGTKLSYVRSRALYLAVAICVLVIDIALIIQGLSMTDYFAG